jgi:hypothetical protein
MNIRFDSERLRKVRALREQGVRLSDVVREAIDPRFLQLRSERRRDAKTSDIRAVPGCSRPARAGLRYLGSGLGAPGHTRETAFWPVMIPRDGVRSSPGAITADADVRVVSWFGKLGWPLRVRAGSSLDFREKLGFVSNISHATLTLLRCRSRRHSRNSGRVEAVTERQTRVRRRQWSEPRRRGR